MRGLPVKTKQLPGFLSVPEAGEVFGLSRNTAYEAARLYRKTDGAEGLPNLKVGGRYLVPVDVLHRMATLPLPGETA